jgi:sporulation protein YlmC with PRC-barrel domain
MQNSSALFSALALGVVAIAPAAVPSSAQALSFVPTQAAGEQSTSSIIGLQVQNPSGDKLGDINYQVLDTSGKVSTVVVGVGGFLGVGEKNVGIPYGELKFSDKDGKHIAVIDASKDSLSAAPNYVWTEKSAMDTLQDDASTLAQQAKQGAAELTDRAKTAAGMKNSSTSSSE